MGRMISMISHINYGNKIHVWNHQPVDDIFNRNFSRFPTCWHVLGLRKNPLCRLTTFGTVPGRALICMEIAEVATMSIPADHPGDQVDQGDAKEMLRHPTGFAKACQTAITTTANVKRCWSTLIWCDPFFRLRSKPGRICQSHALTQGLTFNLLLHLTSLHKSQRRKNGNPHQGTSWEDISPQNIESIHGPSASSLHVSVREATAKPAIGRKSAFLFINFLHCLSGL